MLAVIAGGVVLSLGREVFLPIVAAALLSMLLSPIVAQFERLRLPRIVASLLVILGVVGLLFLAIDALLEPLARALDQLPAMEGLVRRTLRVARYTMGAPFAEWVAARLDEWTAAGKNAASAVLFSRLLTASLGAATVLVLAFFLLASGDLFLQKLIRVIPRIRDKVNALKIVRTVQEEVSRYLLTVTMINAGLGIVVGTVCWYLGLPNAILWGTMVGVLNFIPYIGPFVSLCLLTTASAAHFSTLARHPARPGRLLRDHDRRGTAPHADDRRPSRRAQPGRRLRRAAAVVLAMGHPRDDRGDPDPHHRQGVGAAHRSDGRLGRVSRPLTGGGDVPGEGVGAVPRDCSAAHAGAGSRTARAGRARPSRSTPR